jgi:hypothetical protein
MSEYWIQTFTGKRFDLLEPDESMIDILDIAHHLSIENRFNGATKFAYSVGYHSINVCLFAPKEFKLNALLHDAHEAYTKDLTSPMRRMLRESYDLRNPSGNSFTFEAACFRIQNLIWNKFDVLYDNEIIKEIDLRMALTERNALCVPCPDKWHPSIENKEPFNIEFLKLQSENVEGLFLKEYEKWRRI